MNRGGDLVTGGQPARGPDAYPGLLAALMAAIRPEFRADVLAVDRADPVLGGPSCTVAGCPRAAFARGICRSHYNRWQEEGRPDFTQFAASTGPVMRGHQPAGSCIVPGCQYGRFGRGLCSRHHRAWRKAGKPVLAAWLAAPAATAATFAVRSCRVPSCELWAEGKVPLCLPHRAQWRWDGSPGLEEFAAACEDRLAGLERIDFRPLPAHLRMEVQYAVQQRRDDARQPTAPRIIRRLISAVARSGVTSLLDWPEQAWRDYPPLNSKGGASQVRVLAVYARQKTENLYYGTGWDTEYPRDVWRLRNLGFTGPRAHIRFDGIPQDWLRELAKRWLRWQLSNGLSTAHATRAAAAVTRLGVFLAQAGITAITQVDRAVLERYLAELATLSWHQRRDFTGLASGFFQAIRRHRWDAALPADAMFFREDHPRRPARLPRALAEHVMAQVEHPGNLARCQDPVVRLITIILIRCGLRAGDALALPRQGCIARDGDGAPYLRYYNHKMKREALVPIDEELQGLIGEQQQRVLARWADGSCPHLFPGLNANLGGQRSYPAVTYRSRLNRWLEDCDIRDEHGQPVHLTPHQWRHTLGTRLINRDVPQHVVQKILDHDSPEMTAHYARLSDKTVREHWEKARKVSATGQPVQISPDAPLGDAAWTKHQISRATQALPNGYCQLPVVKTCPHANACLTCPMFVTTPEFLPRHHAQRQATLQLITAAEAAGHSRVAEMNKQVGANLDNIITALEADHDSGQQEAAADVS
jgi:integrase